MQNSIRCFLSVSPDHGARVVQMSGAAFILVAGMVAISHATMVELHKKGAEVPGVYISPS